MHRDLDQLLTTLRGRLPEGADLTSITPLSTGHSNETYRLDGVGLVLRMPPSGKPLVESAHGMQTQFELTQAVRASSCPVPVPAVRDLCLDPAVLGAPFYLMECVDGETFSEYQPSPWLVDADDAFRHDVSRAWFDAIIAVHGTSPLDLLGRPVSNAEELERWHAVARAAGHDGLLSHFERLAAAVPDSSGPPALVHGDPKSPNTLWRDGKLVALLDWEMSFNGDPAWDLGYILVFLASEAHPAFNDHDHPGMLGRPQLIELWEAGTGRSAADVEWFEAASTAKIASLLAYGAHLADTGQSDDPRMSAWGPYVDHFVAQVASVLAPSADATVALTTRRG